MRGFLHSLESFATHDGDGIRAAVFMQGCALRCAYCHNPDTHSFSGGTETDAPSLVARLLRFRPYYGKTGGVTFTGGEPLAQAAFLLDVTHRLHTEGISVWVDTALAIDTPAARELLAAADTVMADLKFFTQENYLRYTGADVFSTVLSLLDFTKEAAVPLVLRTVIVPGINDTAADMLAYAEIAKRYPNLLRYELKPFHTLGFEKYEKLKIGNPFAEKQALEPEKLAQLSHLLQEALHANR